MKKFAILLIAGLTLAKLVQTWKVKHQQQITHAINIRVPKDEPSDANIQIAIDEVVDLYNLSEQERKQLYNDYYVGGGHE